MPHWHYVSVRFEEAVPVAEHSELCPCWRTFVQIYRTGNMTSGMRLEPMDLLKADIIDHVPAKRQEAITSRWKVDLSS